MNRTKIEYLTHTWNPIAMRCTPISEGCRNCWHLARAKRLAKNPMIDEDMRLAFDGGPVIWKLDEMEAPLYLKKPARIGVQFMGDIFHKDVKPEWIDAIWEIMAACPQHTFLVLTKRPQNIERLLYGVTEECGCRELGGGDYLPNVWFGVSVEDQKTADERIPILLQIPAAKRFVSVEPMLGPVDLSNIEPRKNWFVDTLSTADDNIEDDKDFRGAKLAWVISGGESGPGARPLPPDLVRSLRDQCQAAGVPFFFKSWGEWAPDCLCATKKPHRTIPRPEPGRPGVMFHCGHKHSGRLLDGREWKEFPTK